MGQTIEQSRLNLGIAENSGLFTEAEVIGDDDAAISMSSGLISHTA